MVVSDGGAPVRRDSDDMKLREITGLAATVSCHRCLPFLMTMNSDRGARPTADAVHKQCLLMMARPIGLHGDDFLCDLFFHDECDDAAQT